MTILVDEARWPWRDDHWCHLVSDAGLGELHDFAAGLGMRRIGFQGDHYDINVRTRALAINLGAVSCTSRELVRRLRAANLRLRPSAFPKWELHERFDSAPPVGAILEYVAGAPDDVLTALEVAATAASGAFLLRREGGSAVVVHGLGTPSFELGTDDDNGGRYVRVDIDGNWSLEVAVPPLRDSD